MKKNISKAMVLAVFGLLIIGCSDDFLETQPLSQASDVNVWTDSRLAEAAVLDLYQGTWAGALTEEETTEAYTDQAVFTHPGRGVDGYTEGKMTPDPSTFLSRDWLDWPELYPFVRGANIAIAELPKNEAGFDDETLDKLLGEAYYMRGYYYSQLMRQYGGVPLLLEPLNLESEANNPRATFEETVDQIISDLNQAITLLEVGKPPSKGRANKLTAIALKSRVLTHAASDLHNPSKNSTVSTIASYSNPELIGYTSGSPAERWEDAKAASKAFLDEADGIYGYKLDYSVPASREEAIQNYEDIWLEGAENADFIWGRIVEEFGFSSRTYDGGDGWGQGPGMFALNQGPNGYHEWAGTTPTEALVEKYTMADGTPFDWNNPVHAADPYANREPRLYATILFDGAPWKPRTDDVVKHDNFDEIQTGFYTVKAIIKGQLKDSIINGVDTRQGPIEDWNGSRTGYYYKKFTDPTIAPQWPDNLQKVDAPYIRYTEILLNYVEASINSNDEGEAIAWLNRLRYRNGLPEVTASGADLLELYKRERDKELTNEDIRFFDMKRWLEGPYSLDKQVQQVVVVGTQKSGTPATTAYRKDKALFDYTYTPTDIVFEQRRWQDKVYFMPIEQDEINKDQSLIQNPGY